MKNDLPKSMQSKLSVLLYTQKPALPPSHYKIIGNNTIFVFVYAIRTIYKSRIAFFFSWLNSKKLYITVG